MGTVRARLLWNLLGSLVVLAVVAAIALGLPALDRALPAGRPVPADEPYEVGAGVFVVPPASALVDLTTTRPGRDRGRALFLIGAVRYVIVVEMFDGTLAEAVARLRCKIARNPGHRITDAEREVTTGAGLVGRQGGYAAPGRTGRYAVFVVAGRAVEVTASGDPARLDQVVADIERSTASITYRGQK